ncbi:hypothetical protein GCM10027162_11540 [Streptomyces incanus]
MASSAAGTNGHRRRRPLNGSPFEATTSAEGSGTTEPTGPVTETQWLNRDERTAWLANSALAISLPAALAARMQREGVDAPMDVK